MDKKFLKQLARWHEDDEFQKIVDAILALPEEERDYDLTGQLARALNNLEDYETAAEVLLTEDLTIAEVAYSVGINDPFYFSKCFKSQFGVSPSAYRKKLPEGENEPTNDVDV